MSWIYPDTVDPLTYHGFVYLITNKITNQKYVGKKAFYQMKAKKIFRENNWRVYWGSNKDLLAEIESGQYPIEMYERKILHFCVSPGEMSWLELSELIKRDALTRKLPNGLPEYWNGNILMSFNHKVINGYQNTERREKYLATIKKQREAKGL